MKGMSRHDKRVQVFKILFESEFHEIPEMQKQCDLFFDTVGVSDELESIRRELYSLEKQKSSKAVRAMIDDLTMQEEKLIEESESSREEVLDRAQKILALIPELDKTISGKAEGWDIDRMGKVELTILRLAVYEMFYDDDIDTAVAINEAVEIAKEYGQEDSYSFVNGVLSKISK